MQTSNDGSALIAMPSVSTIGEAAKERLDLLEVPARAEEVAEARLEFAEAQLAPKDAPSPGQILEVSVQTGSRSLT